MWSLVLGCYIAVPVVFLETQFFGMVLKPQLSVLNLPCDWLFFALNCTYFDFVLWLLGLWECEDVLLES